MRILFLILGFFSITHLSAQKRYMDMDLKAGIGLPELLHAGLRFNISRAHYDISFGGWPEENQYSVSANYAHHFGKKWKEEWTKQPPWYMSWGGTYMYFRSDVAETHDVYLNGRLGRDFNLLRRRIRFFF